MSDKPQKYRFPAGLFFAGLFTNFIARNLLFFAMGLVLMIVGIWNQWCFMAGLSLLIMDLFLSLYQQLRFRHRVMRSPDEKMRALREALQQDDWRAAMQAWAATQTPTTK